ncbi:MAG: hypothetical protein ACREM3_13750 [Candidatus Rokuibacteriota bacterium]
MRWGRILGIGLAGAVAVVALTWVLEHVMEPPYSGYLALCAVGLTVTGIIKRQPGQRAVRWFRFYFRARARDDEAAARERLLAGLQSRPGLRSAAEAAWRGPTEKERVLAGVAVLLAAEGKRLDAGALSVAYDGVRDKFSIPGWSALPTEFVREVRDRLEERERRHLDALAEKYRLFQQRFFQRPSSLAVDAAASVVDFARLLHSVANRIAKDEPGDAERAYRLSLRLRPDGNLAHAGLALLLERTGRHREAVTEAQTALQVLDHLAERAAERAPATEDIYPFKSPKSLREALERVTRGENAAPP